MKTSRDEPFHESLGVPVSQRQADTGPDDRHQFDSPSRFRQRLMASGVPPSLAALMSSRSKFAVRSKQHEFLVDTSSFASPHLGQFGSAAKGIIKEPGINALASGLAKGVAIKGRIRVRAEITATNILNYPNDSNPGWVVNTAARVGVINAGALETNVGFAYSARRCAWSSKRKRGSL